MHTSEFRIARQIWFGHPNRHPWVLRTAGSSPMDESGIRIDLAKLVRMGLRRQEHIHRRMKNDLFFTTNRIRREQVPNTPSMAILARQVIGCHLVVVEHEELGALGGGCEQFDHLLVPLVRSVVERGLTVLI